MSPRMTERDAERIYLAALAASNPRLRWRIPCGACCAPTGSDVFCAHCGAAICPRHALSQCGCRYQDAG